MFDLSLQWLVVAIDVSVKALVLAVIAAMVLRMPRLRDSNLRHRVWTGVLIGMLILPALSQMVPGLQVPFAIPDHWRIGEWNNPQSIDAPTPIAAAAPEPVIIDAPQETLPLPASNEAFEDPGFGMPDWRDGSSFLPPELGERGGVSPPIHATADARPPLADLNTEKSEPAAVAPPVNEPPLSRWPTALLGAWIVGAGLMALRLLAGLAYSYRLAWSSSAIRVEELTELGVDPRVLTDDNRPVPTWECPLIRVPLALGIFRPRILLPSEWPAWSADKLQAVIAHERTHIQRADGAVVFLAEVNRCLYWFHPLAWWLRSHLGRLAETACDDAAIDCTGDRTTYARHLLEVAATVSGHRTRLITAGISMARPSNVETRINTILDLTRPLSKRLTRTTTLLLLGTLIPLITLAAAVRPATNSRSDEQPPQVESVEEDGFSSSAKEVASVAANDDASQSSDESATLIAPTEQTSSEGVPSTTNNDGESISQSYSGRVETPDGEPVPGAKVWLAVTSYEEGRPGLLRELTGADERGRFQVVLDAATAQEVRRRLPFSQAQLVATAAGRGLDWMPLDVFEDDPAPSEKRDTMQARIDQSLGTGRFAGRTLKLRPESRPIRGRLLDLDGQALSNVTVLVESLRQPDIPLLLKAFEESSKEGVYDAYNATGVGVGGLERGKLQQFIPPVTTDENGAFELAGIGDDQLVSLTFSGERVQAQVVHVLGREMETVRLPHATFQAGGAKDVFAGRDFTYAVGPAVPVEGIVKDFDTGQPVPHTVISVERLFGEGGGADKGQQRYDTRHIRTVTDEQGRFRLTGMPPGQGHVLEAVPPTSEPYLIASQNVSLSLDDGDAKQIEIPVKRGIWIEGRVTDKHTGKPLTGKVDYLALQKNPHTLDKLGLKQGWQFARYRIGKDGRYRTLGLPGPGVVLVTADGGYPRAVGAETVDGYEASKGGGYLPTTPIGLPLSNWNFIKQIDPPADAKSFTCDVELDGGQSVPGRVIGPDGEPITGLNVNGEIANTPFWKPHAASTFTVEGYDGTGPRQLFFKNKAEMLVGQFRLEGDAPEEIVVTLEPAVRVTGRLIENETELPAQRYELHCEASSLSSDKYPRTKFRIDDCRTDDEGRFEIPGLVAGLVYKMNAANPQHFINNRNRFTIDLTDAKPGDVIELGDVTGPNRSREMKNRGE